MQVPSTSLSASFYEKKDALGKRAPSFGYGYKTDITLYFIPNSEKEVLLHLTDTPWPPSSINLLKKDSQLDIAEKNANQSLSSIKITSQDQETIIFTNQITKILQWVPNFSFHLFGLTVLHQALENVLFYWYRWYK